MHPPTSLAFTRCFIQLLTCDCAQSVKHGIMEMTRFLTELSVCDYFFVTRKQSSIAVAALMNAMEMTDSSKLSTKQRQQFINDIFVDTHLEYNSDEVIECRTRLREMYHQGGCGNDDPLDNKHLLSSPKCCDRVSRLGKTKVHFFLISILSSFQKDSS